MKRNRSSTGLRPFLMLWASQSVSSLGTAMTNYALVIWVYSRSGSASSLSLLTLCSFMPTILLRFLAGAAADRWSKKRIMLLADLLAACGTLAVAALHASSALTVMHLYIINLLLSVMNAFQVPAAYVATSILVPPEHYARAGGLQTASDALISILSPALGALVLAWGGMHAVLTIDLITFAVAWLTLLLLRIPEKAAPPSSPEPLLRACLSGLRHLRAHPHLLRLIAYVAAVNFLAKLGPDGLMSAFVLSRTGGSQAALGAVQSCVAAGLLAGGALTSLAKPSRDPVRMVFVMCSLIFAAGMALAAGTRAPVWCAAAFLQYLFAAVMNVHWGTLMRTAVPLEMQGRVFSARDTLQNCTIPLGLFLGGALADHVFEPLLAPAAGAGIAVQFFLVSATGLALSLGCMRMKRLFRPPTES